MPTTSWIRLILVQYGTTNQTLMHLFFRVKPFIRFHSPKTDIFVVLLSFWQVTDNFKHASANTIYLCGTLCPAQQHLRQWATFEANPAMFLTLIRIRWYIY